jgi:DNA gyrase subunit B
MDAVTRTLLQVNVEEAAEAENIMSVLMGDDVESRKAFIQKNARDVRNLDF